MTLESSSSLSCFMGLNHKEVKEGEKLQSNEETRKLGKTYSHLHPPAPDLGLIFNKMGTQPLQT